MPLITTGILSSVKFSSIKLFVHQGKLFRLHNMLLCLFFTIRNVPIVICSTDCCLASIANSSPPPYHRRGILHIHTQYFHYDIRDAYYIIIVIVVILKIIREFIIWGFIWFLIFIRFSVNIIFIKWFRIWWCSWWCFNIIYNFRFISVITTLRIFFLFNF